MPEKILEIACFNLESAIIAEEAGAHRIELCDNYASGGFSPTLNAMKWARQQIKIPLHVMIRPRPDAFGDGFVLSPPETFMYSEMEIQWMIQMILSCRFSGIQGVVLGVLTEQKKIDETVLRRFVEATDTMSVTFHRAIDECENIFEEIEKLIDLGIDRVLTSGGKKNALDAIEVLGKLNEKFKDKITILPGGGIRSSNISEIIEETSCSEFHSPALLNNSKLCDVDEIKKMKEILFSF